MFQIIAGKISAFKTKRCFAAAKYFTVLDFTSYTGNRFIGVLSPAADAFIFFSQIRHANAAVHSAGSDKRIFMKQSMSH